MRTVAILNAGYFAVEFAAAYAIKSVSLFADSIDFLEDASVNLLILLALNFSLRARARVGLALSGILLIPNLATIWSAWQKFYSPIPPDPSILCLTGAGALCINLYCAFRLARFRKHSGSLTRAAFLSARNDAIANIAIIIAGLMTMIVASSLPDLLVGLMIFAINLDAARQVYIAAKKEANLAAAEP